MNLLIPQLNSLSRWMLWGTVSNALLKCRKITSTALPSPTGWVTLSQKSIKLQDFNFVNPCCLRLMAALFLKLISTVPSIIFSIQFFQEPRLSQSVVPCVLPLCPFCRLEQHWLHSCQQGPVHTPRSSVDDRVESCLLLQYSEINPIWPSGSVDIQAFQIVLSL